MNLKKIKIWAWIAVLCAASLCFSGCGGGGGGGSATTPAETPLSVTATSPANGAADVAVNAAITATFNQAMDTNTISIATFSISSGVTGTVAYDSVNHIATFTPSTGLAYGTAYTATISKAVLSSGEKPMAADYVWSFTTGAAPDTTPPEVSSVSPADNATGVAVNAAITATFTEALKGSTVTASSFLLKDGGNNSVSGTVTYNGTTATFTPSANLGYSATYTATVTTGVQDLAGNPMAANYSWTFTTGAAPDTTPPSVVSTTPTNNASGVAVSAAVTATFSEALKASTITTASFLLKDGGNNTISGTVLYSGTTATFTPSVALSSGTTYTATITTGVQDLAGNPMAANYSWSFTTAALSGALDTTFGQGGKVITPVGAGDDEILAAVLQPDGKIVAAGDAKNGAAFNIALVRYNPDGSVDTTFGSSGKVITAVGSGDSFGRAVAIQSNGKIVVAGNAWNGTDNDYALVRYNSDGSLDTTFNTTGKIMTPVGTGVDIAYAVAVQQDGRIIAAGYSSGALNYDFSLVRYNTDGSPDATFGNSGKVMTPVGSANDYATALALQSDGKIVAAGYYYTGSGYDFALVRYNPDGSLDTSFNANGKVTTAVGGMFDYANAVALQSDGKIVVAGSSGSSSNADFAVVRYNGDGSLDTSFNATGKVITPIGASDDYASGVAIQTDGKIVAAGASWNGTDDDFALVRYNADGSLDTSFNNTGKIVTAVGTGEDYIDAVAIQQDGKIVAAGAATNANSDFALTRYWP